jgi:two-component system response regulator DegU
MKLLLVASSTFLRKRLSAILDCLDYVEIFEATVVKETSQEILAMQPEMVVMNAQLPDENGLEALARLRSECPSACFIVISCNSSELYRKRWLQAGADHCFDLTVQIDQFLNLVLHHSQTRLGSTQ